MDRGSNPPGRRMVVVVGGMVRVSCLFFFSSRSEPARSSVQASNLQVQKWTGVQILLGGGWWWWSVGWCVCRVSSSF
jgi:hypothetical protein